MATMIKALKGKLRTQVTDKCALHEDNSITFAQSILNSQRTYCLTNIVKSTNKITQQNKNQTNKSLTVSICPLNQYFPSSLQFKCTTLVYCTHVQ